MICYNNKLDSEVMGNIGIDGCKGQFGCNGNYFPPINNVLITDIHCYLYKDVKSKCIFTINFC